MLSIVIPTLNEEKLLEQTLTALRELRHLKYEIIVSDGGSNDSTLEIAGRFADTVVVHTGSYRQKIGQGKNAGAAAASGDYLVFLDADVVIPEISGFFTQAVELFENDPRLLGLTVFLKVFPETATRADHIVFWAVNRIVQFSNNFLHWGGAPGEFQMVRADAFRKVGGYNEILVVDEDQEMFFGLSKIGKTRVDSRLFVLHTARRAHAIGWPKLVWLWTINLVYTKARRRSFTKEWEVIR